MGFEPFVWYCRPIVAGVWTNAVENAFGAYTPCVIDSLVVAISHLLVLGLCIYRIWLMKKNFTVQRFCLKSKIYNYVLCLLAAYCAFVPLYKLIMGISVLNLDGQTALAPFEVVALIIQALTWSSMVVMLLVEAKVYVFEFRWITRFGVVYILVADGVMLNLILSVKDLYKRYVLYLYISEVFFQALFGVLLLPYMPNLDHYPGHTPLHSEFVDAAEFERLPEGEHICPERHVNFFSNFKISGSSVPFVRGTLDSYQDDDQNNKYDSDGDSIASASFEELEKSEAENFQEGEETYRRYGSDLQCLFQSGEGQLIGSTGVSSIQPIDKKEIPQNLVSVVEDCDLILG
ncbi:ABC transporter C family member 2-like isoform X2 [Benincasa hispida]|nr:ABC transporter C family member 2-like isoform X2 [Benincasa hispida]